MSLNSKVGSKNEKFLENGGMNFLVRRMKSARINDPIRNLICLIDKASKMSFSFSKQALTLKYSEWFLDLVTLNGVSSW